MDNNIRKNIKKISFEEPKDIHIKSLVIYLLIISFISYLSTNFIGNNNIIILFSFIITTPLYLNIFKICLNSARDILINLKDLFKITKYSFKFSLYYSLIIIVIYLLNVALHYIGIFGIIINTILMIYLFPILLIMPFIFLDNPATSLKDFIIKSLKILKKKRGEFYGILCSFILWFLLGFITLGILYIWLIPYIVICIAYFYLNLKKEKKIEKTKALSNMTIIILVLLFIISINIVSFKIYPDSFNDFKKTIYLK